jgi:membrane-associated phospholipid phosphatase
MTAFENGSQDNLFQSTPTDAAPLSQPINPLEIRELNRPLSPQGIQGSHAPDVNVLNDFEVTDVAEWEENIWLMNHQDVNFSSEDYQTAQFRRLNHLDRLTGLDLKTELAGGSLQDLTPFQAEATLQKPPRYSITATLARDTVIDGTTNSDRITADPSISGTVTNRTRSKPKFQVKLDGSVSNAYVDITGFLKPDGSFNLTPVQLEQIYGRTLSDGDYTLRFRLITTRGKKERILSSQTLSFTLDATAPPAITLDLPAAADSGESKNDDLTNIAAPTLTGTAESGSWVQLFDDGQQIGQIFAVNNSWQITTPILTEGSHSLTATVTDIAGNVSELSDPLLLTVDTTDPELSLNPFLDQGTITPMSRLSGVVNGTGSDINALTYRWDNQADISVLLSNTGSFDQSFDLSGLTTGNHTLTLTIIDQAGNQTQSILNVTVVLDAALPVITGGLSNDTAPNGSNRDRITADPDISGTIIEVSQVVQFQGSFSDAAPGAAPVDLLSTLDSQGRFHLDRAQLEQVHGSPLTDGIYTLYLAATDGEGNRSDFSLTFTLDTLAPSSPSFSLAAEFDTAPVGDNRTSLSTVTLVGQGEADATLLLQQTGTRITADASGQFQFVDVPLAMGSNLLTLEVIDAAGNRSVLNQTITRLSDGSDPVLDWNAFLLQAIQTDRTAPPIAAYNMALMHTAIYDAVNAIARTYSVYEIDAQAPQDASEAAAVSAAAYTILKTLYPRQTPTFDAEYLAALAAVPDGAAEDAGVTLGAYVATQMLALREEDGSDAVAAYTPGIDPGDWQPTPTPYQPGEIGSWQGPVVYDGALLPQWGEVTPFALNSGDQFRPGGPPALDSAEYAAEFNQVKDLGSNTSTIRTADQTEIAKFWADGAGTYTPSGHWNQIAEQAAINSDNSLLENARLFALLNISLADAGIAAWDAKYTYDFWRPYTAIHNAETDGNALTAADPNWTPLIKTPPFPEYVSGHSMFSGAAATVLTSFFGDNYQFSATSMNLPGITRTFNGFYAAADEAGISRIYGGIHFLSSNQDGLATGKSVGGYVLDNFLKPVISSTRLQAGLANDTAALGEVNRDRVTSDPTITGQVTATNGTLKAGFDATALVDFRDITAVLDNAGKFTLTQAQLEQIYGGTLSQGTHTLYLRLLSHQGLVLDTTAVTFTFDTVQPTLALDSAIAGAEHSATARLIGQITDLTAGATSARYSLDGQGFTNLEVDAQRVF